ncbi:MAG: heme exporter protein CcmD [Gammaproteobacteria bacterium]
MITTAFETIDAFWAMGGHGFYVWAAYGMWFVTLGVLLVQTAVARRRVRSRLRLYYEEQTITKTFMRDKR